MDDEYIKRDLVIEMLEEKQRAICPVGRYGRGYVYGRDRDEYDAIESDIDAVQNIPSADVRPVVKAQWALFGRRGIYGVMYECSACHAKYDGRTNFCPNCGAKMDLQEE